MAFQLPTAAGGAAPVGGSPAPAATSTAVVPVAPPAVLSSAFDSYTALLEAVQDAWSDSANVDELRRVLIQHMNSMATIQEQVSSAHTVHIGVDRHRSDAPCGIAPELRV